MTPLSSFGRTRATLSTGGHPLDVSVGVGVGVGGDGGWLGLGWGCVTGMYTSCLRGGKFSVGVMIC